MNYPTGETIRALREKKRLTQKQLAEKLRVTDKAVSKWEMNRGLPDVTILPELAQALSVSVPELLTGDVATNRNVCANVRRSRFYVCPICGNVIHAMGEGAFSCCGVRLPALEAEALDAAHALSVETVDGEWYVRLHHPMTKKHFISFAAYLTDDRVQMKKFYPEQEAEVFFQKAGHGQLCVYCNRDGLFCVSL